MCEKNSTRVIQVIIIRYYIPTCPSLTCTSIWVRGSIFRRDTSPVLWGLHRQKRPGQVFSIDTAAILDACTTLMSRTLRNIDSKLKS